MKAAVITKPGGPEVLAIEDRPKPKPGEREVLVRVHATALNRADTLQRMGRYPAPPGAPPDTPGLELAGEVAERGPSAGRWGIGARVFGIVPGGGNAEFAVVQEDELAAIPAGMSWTDAAAVPEAFITAHDALVTQASARAGECVLVHAVGSGVGLAVAQLTRAIGARCFGTARSADKIERARAYGLEDGVAIDDPAAVPAHVMRWTKDHGADVILDLVGGAYATANVECAALRARIIVIGLLAGRSATLNLGAVLSKRLTMRGTTLRSRPHAEKVAATQAFARDVLPMLANGSVKPVVDRVLPLAAIAEAHAILESNETFGKVVLRVP